MRETRDSIADIWGERAPYRGAWPVRVDERLLDEPDRWVQGACVLCSNGCALDIGVKEGRMVGVRGRAVDRVNHGRLGPKGMHGWRANQTGERLTTPLLRRNGKLEPAGWDEAMDLIVQRTREILANQGATGIGMYTSGQLFLEEYYTLALIAKAGLRTLHVDGNIRLCTATAEASLWETFGTDGQPCSYTDFDTADALLHIGHNVASQQTVLWMRILDRRRGPNPPKMVVIDPRRTDTAAEADVHLAPRVGTNLPVLNGLLHLIIEAGQIDTAFVEAHTVGYDALAATVKDWTPERVEHVSGVPAALLRAAAEIVGTASTLSSTVLQGVYQSMQATASAMQVNNLHLIRGLIGKPGCGIFQMNGQPSSQNTRECGCSSALPAFRNWQNPRHVADLARLWNVEPERIAAWGPGTHAMEMWRYAEEGTIKMLWISGTNPAVSLPDLGRIRDILANNDLFVVAQDGWLTETASRADVVLPAAIWAEKTGTLTNADRTVHLSIKAVEPPGEARPDLDIFLDYARRMDFRDKDGAPLIKWSDPEGAFEAWKACSRGRPCDYSGLSYAKLSGRSGIQWPCNEEFPAGKERLYSDGIFNTFATYCEDYGHDPVTGAQVTREEYRAHDPAGRAILKSADYLRPVEQPDDEYPLWLTTGRVVYQWHTRTKTARVPDLNAAAPRAYVEMSQEDATRYGIAEGEMVEVVSRRGSVEVPARIGDIPSGTVFIPFHYGYWDNPGHRRAANELTLTNWDPVSKQPYVKFAAVRLGKGLGTSLLAGVEELVGKVAGTAKAILSQQSDSMHLGTYIGLVRESEEQLAEALTRVVTAHAAAAEIHTTGTLLASWSREHAELLGEAGERYGAEKSGEPKNLEGALFSGPRTGPIGLLRDLQDLLVLAGQVQSGWLILFQAARALPDWELAALCARLDEQTQRQIAWIETHVKLLAAQALVAKQ